MTERLQRVDNDGVPLVVQYFNFVPLSIDKMTCQYDVEYFDGTSDRVTIPILWESEDLRYWDEQIEVILTKHYFGQ
jgi:hypothetical protein